MKTKLKTEEKRLVRRYLLWCYKTTQEEFDRIERKFTQLKVDFAVLKDIRQNPPKIKDAKIQRLYDQIVAEFETYIKNKETEAFRSKFYDQPPLNLLPRYVYLQGRLTALKRTCVRMLGRREFDEIVAAYEREMTRRILETKEHT